MQRPRKNRALKKSSCGVAVSNSASLTTNLQVAVNGKPVEIKESRKFSQIFGMNPAETIGAASVSFVPSDTKAASVAPQNSNWKWLDLRLKTP
jgi:hypothetical protein